MARKIKNTDPFKERLLKLIPSEIVAAYVAIQGVMISIYSMVLVQLVIAFLTIITFLYLHRIEKVIDLKHKIFSTVSFPVWVYAVAPESILGSSIYNPQLASIVLVLWTLLIPLVVVPKITDQPQAEGASNAPD
ncbi:hypothetical protein [Vibrio agarivorans]|uniref:DUF805 domain-containing protein n=1 Tax=Vibrio agarivorans TaxID=153622 RepID=A0ABT7XYX5_9VIBR|nr:hypothetical protein [Vibrio agarivorans]MDN2480969.1 hypothetical protein [Vibrio agarivorans]